MASHSPFIITELLHDGPDVALYRGRREADGTPVTVKLLKGERANLQQIARLRHEHRITQGLGVDGVIKVYGVSKLHGGIGLIMEDVGGRPLQRYVVEERLDLGRILAIGVSLAGTLAALHARGIIHKDVKPSNILYRADTGRVVLTDFGIAARTSEGSIFPRDPDAIEGTLAYMSPEQTGRTNRTLDYRTDLYSLGVTLYELLAGSLPFSTTDPMELVHSHIARVPRKLHERDESVPEAVSAVVMKLLEKAAEDRYQSALGLQADLEACLRQWRDKGRIDPFPLGSKEATGELHVPGKLYQREDEVAALLAAFARVFDRVVDRVVDRSSAAELVLCKGYAGVGKSALVHAAHRSIASRGVAFITGTFEKRGQGTSSTPVVSAFRELVRSLLAERPEVWAQKKAEILAAVSPNGRLLADLIPELDLILEHEPSIPELQPSAAETRFTLVFQRFVRVFTASGDPLVLFLDDLQWADPASLSLLLALLTDPEGGKLLVIGAYRDHEVGAGHPLPGMLAALERAGVGVTEIALGPLDRMNTQRLLADALGGAAPWLLPLAELLYDKTRGNPFFLHQLLHELTADGLLSFDPKAKRWVWDEERILARKATDNVAELMVGKIQRLSAEAQRALMLAACIGIAFDLQTLSIIYEKSPVETSLDLWEALREGLAFSLDIGPTPTSPVSYRFSHDRVLDAAYSLLSAEEREAIHLRIGRLRREQLGALLPSRGPSDQLLFDAVNHCNLGASGITDPAEREDIARLDLAAGKKAMARAAYEAAAGYLRAATSLLPKDSFADDYALAFEVTLARAECAQRGGHAEEAEALFAVLDRKARSRLDRARIATLRVGLYTTLSRFADAFAVARRGLSLFGIELPDTPAAKQAAFDAELAKIPVNLGERSPEELVSAPILRDPDELAVRDLLVATTFTDLPLYSFLCALRANHCLKHGRSEASAFIYAAWSALLMVPMNRHTEARGFFRAACALNEEASESLGAALRCKTFVTIASTAHFFEPLRTAIVYCEQAIQAGLEAGDLTCASDVASVGVMCRLGAGDELSLVQKDLDRSLSIARRAHDEVFTLSQEIVGRFIERLRGHGEGAPIVDPWLEIVYFQRAVTELELSVLFGDDASAIERAARAEEAHGRFPASHAATLIPFYASLARLSLAFAAPAEERARHQEAIERHQQRLAELAAYCPENYGYQHLLVAAERARVEDRPLEAAELYDQAIAAARERQVTHHEALANELAARFYFARNREKIGRAYLVDAHQGYLLWGATAKVEAIVRQHPQLLSTPGEALVGQLARVMKTTTITQTKGMEGLDVAAVIRVGQTIAGEIVLDKLLSRVMRSVIENAGAERGLLLLEREGRLMIEARINLDPDELAVGLAIPALESAELPRSIVQFVARTREPMVLGDAARDERFGADPYIAKRKPRSILCVAMAHQGRLAGLLYLENNVVRDAFTQARVEVAGLLASQAAIAVENALLIADIQRRTDALHAANEQLQRELVGRAALEQELLRVQTPLIPITEGIMVMPLIGSIDETRANLLLETMLGGAKQWRAKFVILDITGVPEVDAKVAATLLRAARALRLLGSEAVITGIRPAVAQALVELGVDLGQVVTQGTLEGGIAFAQKNLGRTGGAGKGKPRIVDPRA